MRREMLIIFACLLSILTACEGSSGGSIAPPPSTVDTDGDGLTDTREASLGSDPAKPDSDSDGLTDGDEVNTHGTSATLADSDGDFIWDGEELNMFSTDPNVSDSDGDGIDDRADPQPTIAKLIYAANGPTGAEIDADPHWGPNNRITFKREDIGNASRYSRVYTATIDTATRTLSDVTLRTDNPNQVLIGAAAGDYDPKISPDGTLITSYRHLANPTSPTDPNDPLFDPADFGDYDIWVGQYSDALQPDDVSLIFLDVTPATINLFPRWNTTGDKLAVWQTEPGRLRADPIDIVVFDLTIQMTPFAVTSTSNNITAGDGWTETMPSWNTDLMQPDTLVYSASR